MVFQVKLNVSRVCFFIPGIRQADADADADVDVDVDTEAGAREMKVPWDDILRSTAVYATAFSHFTSNWTHYTMQTCLPLYLHNVLRFNVDAVSEHRVIRRKSATCRHSSYVELPALA
jgi:hypothetical protein